MNGGAADPGDAPDTVPMAAVRGERTDEQPSAAPRPFSTPDTTGARAAVTERMATLVAREERAKLAERLRWTIRIGTPCWLAFAVMDLIAIAHGAGPWWAFVLLRLGPLAVGWSLYPFLSAHDTPPYRRLRFTELAIFSSMAVSLGGAFSLHGGWVSPRIPVFMLVPLSYAILLGTRWRTSLPPVALPLVLFPATLAAVSLVRPDMRAQMADPEALATFANLYFPVVVASGLALVGGHTTWRLRQMVAEARSLGRYKLRRRIAAGGMGEVWAAYHVGLRRDVAVKLIHEGRRADPVVAERFDREVQTLAELTHPNTVRVFDHGATETGVLYYAMELLDGDDLDAVLDEEGPMSCERAVRLVTQAAQALGEAHERGIVHRDIKPSNLLVIQRGRGAEFVKLIDFGIAKQAEEGTLTQTGIVMGTPGYIAPEVLTGGPATPRADVYALAMVLYVLLTDDMPHRGDTPMMIARQALEVDVPPLSASRDDVPPELDEVVSAALSRDPFERYPDATAFAEALRDAL